MTFHVGNTFTDQEISIRSPSPADIRQAPQAVDVADSVLHWIMAAKQRSDIYYFSVYHRNTLVGQILLHDIDREVRTSLIAYHIFEQHNRSQGMGTTALRLLVRFVVEETNLNNLVIITSRNNLASQRIAEKCGFVYTGAPREDPLTGTLFEWNRPE